MAITETDAIYTQLEALRQEAVTAVLDVGYLPFPSLIFIGRDDHRVIPVRDAARVGAAAFYQIAATFPIHPAAKGIGPLLAVATIGTGPSWARPRLPDGSRDLAWHPDPGDPGVDCLIVSTHIVDPYQERGEWWEILYDGDGRPTDLVRWQEVPVETVCQPHPTFLTTLDAIVALYQGTLAVMERVDASTG